MESDTHKVGRDGWWGTVSEFGTKLYIEVPYDPAVLLLSV